MRRERGLRYFEGIQMGVVAVNTRIATNLVTAYPEREAMNGVWIEVAMPRLVRSIC